ncbi:MAG: hypothetical protein E7374_00070 [Clostridiales bacterium]|nr:hypothetical protein [Clostridiales bacterium]
MFKDDFDMNDMSAEQKIEELKKENARLQKIVDDYKKKEMSISNAIISSMEHANQLEASRRKLYLLDIQRSRLMYLRMEQIINELYNRYPEIRKDSKLKDMSDKFKSMVYNEINEKRKENVMLDVKKQNIADDPIKKLLHNIINCFDTKTVVEEEKFTEKEEVKSTSGFDLNEALHPTMGLDEIMKSFNLDGKKGEGIK